MTMNNPTASPSIVAGYFSSRTSAERAVQELKDAGFTPDEIRMTEPSLETPDQAITPNLREAAPYITAPGLGHGGLPGENDSRDQDGVILTVAARGRARESEFILERNGADFRQETISYT